MEFLGEIIFEAIGQVLFVYVLGVPGAWIRWTFTGFKKGKLDYYTEKETGTNVAVFLAFAAVVGGIVTLICLLFPS